MVDGIHWGSVGPLLFISLAIMGNPSQEDLVHGTRFETRHGHRSQDQPRVVVDEIEDFNVAAISELPVGAVGLPHLVGQLGLEALD